MSWMLSKALCESLPYSPALAGEYSAASCLDGKPFAEWNVMPTPQGFWRNDKMMDASRLSQFGPTLQLLTEQDGEAVLTLFLADFPAKTYQQPEPAKGLMERGVDCGGKWHASLAKYDPTTHSLKTAQCSLFEDLTEFSAILPRWGLMRDGELYQQPTLAQITKEKESGLLPTMLATDWKGGTTAIRKDKGTQRLDQWRDYVKVKYSMTYPHPTHSEL
ncbi:MAG: hypothetical protein ACJA1I_000528 [Zhongshania marina]|jgi:hypothetical protein